MMKLIIFNLNKIFLFMNLFMNNNDYVENVENKKEKIFDRINIALLQSIF